MCVFGACGFESCLDTVAPVQLLCVQLTCGNACDCRTGVVAIGVTVRSVDGETIKCPAVYLGVCGGGQVDIAAIEQAGGVPMIMVQLIRRVSC